MVYDTLFSLDENLVPQPQMVGKYEVSGDGLTYTFTLRDGLKFHDGTPVTAEDVVASLKRWWVKDGRWPDHPEIFEGAVGGRRQDLPPRPDAALWPGLDTLAKPDANVPVIMPKRLAVTDPNQAITEVVGSGPFKFAKDEWVPGSKVVFTKNTDYVPRSEPANGFSGGKVVKVDRVEWVVLPDPQSAIQALNRGQIDFIEIPPADLLPLLKANKDVVVQDMQPAGHARHPAHQPSAAALHRRAGSACHAMAGQSARLHDCGDRRPLVVEGLRLVPDLRRADGVQ